MNSLNFVSSRVSPSSSAAPSRSSSLGSIGITVTSEEEQQASRRVSNEKNDTLIAEPDEYEHAVPIATDRTPLLAGSESKNMGVRQSAWHLVPKRIASFFIDSLRLVLSTLAAPGVYLMACFYDEYGNFAPLVQLRKLFGIYHADPRELAADQQEKAALEEKGGGLSRGETFNVGRGNPIMSRPIASSGSSSSGLSSESESEYDKEESGLRHLRSKSSPKSEEISPSRRSIRIKLHNEEALRQRKHKRGQSSGSRGGASGGQAQKDISAHLKSPTSPVGALTRYPKTPAPPRPLVPRRQPSYINVEPSGLTPQKTLILDLDETLIHSMSKGGRMSTGHMVEVKLNTTYVGVGGQASIGPQHPILYYVHKRPHCDDFLRRVCKWFNLVVFTASVQEYADPVIDWLESERKFFSARYYRQHCTFRHGAFIKDISSVEPDLSKVMILDNSPLSYMFHQDNAIPIQGWINDPTDNDLQHLIPFLEGLQYVSDVRALLALRGGEDGQHMVS
ncbi:Nuclear envelope morphology protein 1 [Cytospora mali]|uniref:Nuclear envelope morphology protein 1 n=1 Tax=Cytospora mali TaxID=578113 RepID=A0A194W8S6_CYTMA|nr:Nuclear envelope morphology protein 1 [Valsa mali]